MNHLVMIALIVLAVLVVMLIAAVVVMKSELSKRGKKDAEAKIVSTTTSSVNVRTGSTSSAAGSPGVQETDEISEEVIAAIAGALAAYGTNGRRLVIKNIRRVQGGSSAWENSGRMDLLQ